MFLAQARATLGMHIVAVADLNVRRAASQLQACNWPAEQYAARSLEEARRTGRTYLTDSADDVVQADGIEVIIEATGDPRTGISLALGSIAAGKHIVMVNVEADVVAGPLLARRAREAGGRRASRSGYLLAQVIPRICKPRRPSHVIPGSAWAYLVVAGPLSAQGR